MAEMVGSGSTATYAWYCLLISLRRPKRLKQSWRLAIGAPRVSTVSEPDESLLAIRTTGRREIEPTDVPLAGLNCRARRGIGEVLGIPVRDIDHSVLEAASFVAASSADAAWHWP